MAETQSLTKTRYARLIEMREELRAAQPTDLELIYDLLDEMLTEMAYMSIRVDAAVVRVEPD